MLPQFIYMICFFSVFLDTLDEQKVFFCTLGPKITYFYILGGHSGAREK